MQPKTKSELLLENYCTSRSYLFKKIPETQHKTPDYEITISSSKILAEVKEFIEEVKVKTPHRVEIYSTGGKAKFEYLKDINIGQKFAQKIAHCLEKFQTIPDLNYPSIAILVNSIEDSNGKKIFDFYHLDNFHLTVAFQKLVLPSAGHCLSAICLLDIDENSVPFMRTYHNPSSKSKLPENAFYGENDRHFRPIISSDRNIIKSWEECSFASSS